MDFPKELLELSKNDSGKVSDLWAVFLNKLYRYRLLLKRRWWILLLTVSLGLGGAAWWESLQPPLFASISRMMVSGKITLPDGAAYNEELANFFGTQIELMRSGEVQHRAQQRVQSLHPELAPVGVALDVAQLKGTSIFMLRATSAQPDYTPLFLDACMEEYINSKRELRSEKSEDTVTAITGELVRLEKELRDGEQELLDFQKKNNVGFLQEEGNSAASYLVAQNRQIANLRTEYDLLKLLDVDQNLDRVQKDSSEKANGTNSSGASLISSFGPEAEYMKAKQQIELLKAQREDFAKVLRPAHPTMIQLNEDIGHLETLVATFRTQSVEQLKTRRESIALQLQNLEKVSQEWEAKALDLSQRMAEYDRIKSKVDRTKAVYDRLLTSLRNVDVTQRIDQDMVSILEKASPPMSVRPGLIKTALLGLGAGLMAGLAIFFLLEQIDDRMTSSAELAAHFPEPILALIPQERHKSEELPLLNLHDQRHAFSESFRALRSSIFYLPASTPSRIILVTSAVPNEGKSVVSTNLAITLAFGEVRVLLIDADLRRGNLHGAFGLKNPGGLADLLVSGGEVSKWIQPTAIPGLSLLPRGSSIEHPGEHFLKTVTDETLETLRARFDYIVIDTAPVMVADDTSSLAPKVDACLYVVRFAYSSAAVSRKALNVLGARQAKVMGLVCNEVHRGMPEYYHYYQYPEYYGAQAAAEV